MRIVHEVKAMAPNRTERVTRTRVTPTPKERQDLEALIGDGKASIERSRSIKFSVGYGNISIHSTCGVRLTCNQDEDTLRRATDIATSICDRVVFEQDTEVMKEFLEHYASQ